MTQRIKVAGPGFDFATLSAAIASLPVIPFIEPIVIEVHSTAPSELITIPSTVLPTAANPLIIMSFRSTPVPPLFPDFQLVSGVSLPTYPAPQPRLVKATMGFLDIRSDNTFIDGLRVAGDVAINSNFNVHVQAILVVGGQIRVFRAVPTAVDATISSCEVRKGPSQSAIRISKATGVKVYSSTALQRAIDASLPGTPCFALDVENGSVDARNNIFAGDGESCFAVRFSGNPALSNFRYNFYAAFGDGKLFKFDDGGPITETGDINVWRGFMPSEGVSGSLSGDPEFRKREDPADPDLDISNTSPAIAGVPALAAVTHDVRGERRPIDFSTMGAHEHGEIITEDGKKRFLELLAGLSSQAITKAVLGHVAEAPLFTDFPAQLASDQTMDPIFSPAPFVDAVVPALPGSEGTVVFRAGFQVTLPNYAELLNPTFDRANEMGLVAGDNKVFLIKRMHSIPFDSVGFMSSQVQIPVEIVS